MRPIFFENSLVPVILSKISPIEIKAISLGVVVFSKEKMSPQTKLHETIHFHQWIELGFIGFIILYLWDYLHGLRLYGDGAIAYSMIRAEQEAYDNDTNDCYIQERKRYEWIRKYRVNKNDHL
jgi:hypothetical protein